MPLKLKKLTSLLLCFLLILQQTSFAQTLDLSHYFTNPAKPALPSDKFRPLHLRYLGYDNLNNDFKILLDKGDTKKEDLENKTYLDKNTQTLLKYFFIGLVLPNDKFWVNLRPDAPDNIIDDDLARTDIGRIFLEADVQLKKDTAQFTSPQTPEGKAYWDKLYQKAGELFGTENITIPTITRPWIVPNEIIIREAPDNAYIYKATLKVMLEEDYLESPSHKVTRSPDSLEDYSFKDPRLKELNQYSTQLIKELIIPKLTYQANTAKRYAPLRQVYYSLILAQWFKQKYKDRDGSFKESVIFKNRPFSGRTVPKIDSGDLTNLTSKEPYDKQTYFKQYQQSFKDGEYNLTEPIYILYGQNIRRYISGGMKINASSAIEALTSSNMFMPQASYLSSLFQITNNGKFLEIKVVSPVLSVSSAMEKPSKSPAIFETSRGIQYEIIGDFGPVYRDVKIVIGPDGKEMVIKPVRNRDGQEPEIGFAKKLKHSGIVIGELIQDNKGNNFLLMPYIKGETLEGFVKRIDIPVEEKLRRFSTIASDLTEILVYLGSLDFRYNDPRFSPQFDRHFIIEEETGKLKLIDFERVGELKNPELRHLYNAMVLIDAVNLLKGSLPIPLQSEFEQKLDILYGEVRDSRLNDLDKLCEELKELIESLISKIRSESTEEISQETTSSAVESFASKKSQSIPAKPEDIKKMLRGHNIVDALLDYPDKLYGKIFFDKGVTPLSDDDHKKLFDFLWSINKLPDKLRLSLPGILKEKIIKNRRKLDSVMGSIVEGSIKDEVFILLKMVLKDEFPGDSNTWDYLDSIEAFQNKKGGIDFAALPIVTQQIKSLQSLSASPLFINPNLNLDAEWTQIQAVFNAGIRPSVQRLVEFSVTCASSPAESRRKEDVIGLIADFLRREEEAQKLTPTDPALKGLLSALET